MCTLVVAAGLVPGYPLLIVANRDEQKDRAASPPMSWPSTSGEGGDEGDASFIAPRDDVAGGTWLGLNEHGVFVGITNRFLGPRDTTRISRGALVVDALRLGTSARAIHEAMSRIDPTKYNGFHLVYADTRDVLATISDGDETLAQLVLGNGLSVVTERSFAGGRHDDQPRLEKIRSVWSRIVDHDDRDHQDGALFDPAKLTKLLTVHDAADPLGATCIHLDELRYGTRSSMVLSYLATEKGAVTSMLWAEGPPCTTAFSEIKREAVSAGAKTG
jgi:uncharacterized protein with NRDE domain